MGGRRTVDVRVHFRDGLSSSFWSWTADVGVEQELAGVACRNPSVAVPVVCVEALPERRRTQAAAACIKHKQEAGMECEGSGSAEPSQAPLAAALGRLDQQPDRYRGSVRGRPQHRAALWPRRGGRRAIVARRAGCAKTDQTGRGTAEPDSKVRQRGGGATCCAFRLFPHRCECRLRGRSHLREARRAFRRCMRHDSRQRVRELLAER